MLKLPLVLNPGSKLSCSATRMRGSIAPARRLLVCITLGLCWRCGADPALATLNNYLSRIEWQLPTQTGTIDPGTFAPNVQWWLEAPKDRPDTTGMLCSHLRVRELTVESRRQGRVEEAAVTVGKVMFCCRQRRF